MSRSNARKRRATLPVTLSALTAGALTLAACGGGGSATTEAGGEVFTLTIGAAVPTSSYPSIATVSEIFVPRVQECVAAEITHEIEFNEHYGTVVEVGEELDALSSGQLDMGTLGFADQPSELPLHNLAYYVPFSSSDAEVAVAAFREIHENNEAFAGIYEEHNQMPLAFYTVGDYGLGSNFPVNDVEDLRGREIAGVGANLEWLAPMDIVPVQAPSTEWYSSFQTGVYDGVVSFVRGFDSLRLSEVLTHYVDLSFGAVVLGALTVNLDTWESLPTEAQDVIVEVGQEFEVESAQTVNAAAAESIETMADEGMDVVQPRRPGRPVGRVAG